MIIFPVGFYESGRNRTIAKNRYPFRFDGKTQPIQTQCIRLDKRQQKRADPPLLSRLLQTIRSTARATLACPQGNVRQEYSDCHQQDSGACHDRGCLCF
jgi:hypothetical protein